MSRPARRDADERRRAWRRGISHEAVAAVLLMAKGYRILARRYAARGGEIDIVARRRDLVVFVEVKSRRDIAEAETAVTAEKRRRILRAIRQWQSGRQTAGLSFRIDAVFMSAWMWPRHVEGIFEIDER